MQWRENKSSTKPKTVNFQRRQNESNAISVSKEDLWQTKRTIARYVLAVRWNALDTTDRFRRD